MDPLPFSVGVGVFVRDPVAGTFLVGKRGKACRRGPGCYALPGGHVEEGETVAAAVLREVEEETGLNVQLSGGYADRPFSVPGLLAVTDHSDVNQQRDGLLLPHLSLWVMTAYAGGTPVAREPDKCGDWLWVPPTWVASLEGVTNPTHPQYYWTPLPLWRAILRPYFGEF